MKQPNDKYTQELNLEPRQQSDGERAAWLADKIDSSEIYRTEMLEAADLLRKYSELEARIEKSRKEGFLLAKYKYPYNLLPQYHHALYQLLVGVEQRHSDDNLQMYAKQLRELAIKVFKEYEPMEIK